MTNKEAMQNMSDYDFARYIGYAVCPPDIVSTDCPEDEQNCIICWMRWLNKEAKT